ncbi:EamA domain-containing membrane protein RarD [Tamilnaduibacter salinus]|uniref:EamA domain-containing membrane protein RarD n=1 Tax=Tamilnaduibacter salinus TaxID=1484056 RepID=A0A2U1CUM9_9GAMM|nr:DMT family transporter [Tamilnaduibacter salinus]PVY70714.1 EamA domain-containing membrane protein RarD [Tamilnaduibacter salinus]
MSFQRQRALAITGLVMTTLFWGGNALVARATAETIPPLALSFWRWFIPCIYLLPFTIRAFYRYRHTLRQNRLKVLVLALFSVGAYNTILYLAAQSTTAINIALVAATMPLMIVLLSALILRVLPGGWQWLGLISALAGVLTILSQASADRILSITFNPGDVLMVLSITCWALYSVLLKRWPLAIPPFPLLCILITLGVPMILPFYLWELAREGGFALNTGTVGALLYVGTLPSVAAYSLWINGLREMGPGTAGLFAYLIPVFTALIAVPVLGESIELYHAIGGALVLIGLIAASRQQATIRG